MAIACHLLEAKRCFTLFATHYFELTQLARLYPDAANAHLDAVEHGHQVVFLHSVEEGPASQSYGLQVAALAGVPAAVVRQARRHLARLESEGLTRDRQGDLFAAPLPAEPAAAAPPHALLARLAAVDPDALTPREALDLVYELIRLARD